MWKYLSRFQLSYLLLSVQTECSQERLSTVIMVTTNNTSYSKEWTSNWEGFHCTARGGKQFIFTLEKEEEEEGPWEGQGKQHLIFSRIFCWWLILWWSLGTISLMVVIISGKKHNSNCQLICACHVPDILLSHKTLISSSALLKTVFMPGTVLCTLQASSPITLIAESYILAFPFYRWGNQRMERSTKLLQVLFINALRVEGKVRLNIQQKSVRIKEENCSWKYLKLRKKNKEIHQKPIYRNTELRFMKP